VALAEIRPLFNPLKPTAFGLNALYDQMCYVCHGGLTNCGFLDRCGKFWFNFSWVNRFAIAKRFLLAGFGRRGCILHIRKYQRRKYGEGTGSGLMCVGLIYSLLNYLASRKLYGLEVKRIYQIPRTATSILHQRPSETSQYP